MPGLLQPFLGPGCGMLLALGSLELSYPSPFVGQHMKGLGNHFEGHNSGSTFLHRYQAEALFGCCELHQIDIPNIRLFFFNS